MFPPMTHASFAVLLALVGIVILVSSQPSGLVEVQGAALAWTDPVMLHSLLRNPNLQPAAGRRRRRLSGRP
jgi:hypothetical protein